MLLGRQRWFSSIKLCWENSGKSGSCLSDSLDRILIKGQLCSGLKAWQLPVLGKRVENSPPEARTSWTITRTKLGNRMGRNAILSTANANLWEAISSLRAESLNQRPIDLELELGRATLNLDRKNYLLFSLTSNWKNECRQQTKEPLAAPVNLSVTDITSLRLTCPLLQTSWNFIYAHDYLKIPVVIGTTIRSDYLMHKPRSPCYSITFFIMLWELRCNMMHFLCKSVYFTWGI